MTVDSKSLERVNRILKALEEGKIHVSMDGMGTYLYYMPQVFRKEGVMEERVTWDDIKSKLKEMRKDPIPFEPVPDIVQMRVNGGEWRNVKVDRKVDDTDWMVKWKEYKEFCGIKTESWSIENSLANMTEKVRDGKLVVDVPTREDDERMFRNLCGLNPEHIQHRGKLKYDTLRKVSDQIKEEIGRDYQREGRMYFRQILDLNQKLSEEETE